MRGRRKKEKEKKKARLINLEIYLVGCHVAKTKGSHALADTGPGQTINLPCHATIAAGPQRNSGPSSRLRKRTSELGSMEECSPEQAASPLPLLLNTDGTRLPSTMRKSLRGCAQPWFNRSTSSESPLRWIAAFSRPLVEERFRSNQGRNQQKATAMSIYRTTRKTIDFREMPIRHVPVSAHGALFFMLPRPDPMSKFGERYQEEDVGKHSRMQRGELCPTFADMLTLDTC